MELNQPGIGTDTIYVSVVGEEHYERPLDVVWRHVVNYPEWQNYSVHERLEGVAGTEGELMKLKKAENLPSTEFFSRTVFLEPGSRIIWRIFRPNCAVGGCKLGTVQFSVLPRGNGATFSYNLLYEFIPPSENQSERDRFRLEQTRAVATLLATVFPRLRKLIADED